MSEKFFIGIIDKFGGILPTREVEDLTDYRKKINDDKVINDLFVFQQQKGISCKNHNQLELVFVKIREDSFKGVEREQAWKLKEIDIDKLKSSVLGENPPKTYENKSEKEDENTIENENAVVSDVSDDDTHEEKDRQVVSDLPDYIIDMPESEDE